ncbi:MAG: tetratricopeptide repeat protein, partial [Ignavibacteria bacterium]|nr:tetratricopeptide repeat protein [Ignavibacteria bacterium]
CGFPQLATLLLIIQFQAVTQDTNREASVSQLLAHGYEILDSNPTAAIPFFEQAVRTDSTHLLARRQLASLYITSGRTTEALKELRAANHLHYSDTTALQIAYLLNLLEENQEAYDMFAQLRTSNDPAIREKAIAAGEVLSPMLCAESHPWWTRVYAAPYYDSRFSNSIFAGALHGGHYQTSDRLLSLFGTVALTRDTRSSGGAVPEIFSDNYFLLGVGVRVEPVRNFITDIQAGMVFDLVERPGKASTNGDIRIVSSYGAGWYPSVATAPELAFSFLPFADFYSAVGYYSRYSNVIGYGHGRGGARIATSGPASLDVYLRADLSGDTDRAFYNNIAELSVGARVIPDYRWGLSILLEQHRGTYWGSSTTARPYERYYSSFRIFLVLDKPLCF